MTEGNREDRQGEVNSSMIAGQTLPQPKDRDVPTAAMPQLLPAVRAGSPAIGSRSEVLVNRPNGVEWPWEIKPWRGPLPKPKISELWTISDIIKTG